jgi:hypothetical protein
MTALCGRAAAKSARRKRCDPRQQLADATVKIDPGHRPWTRQDPHIGPLGA